MRDGLKAKAERKNKAQEKILKSQAQAELLLSPDDALWHRPLISSLWKTQHGSDTQGLQVGREISCSCTRGICGSCDGWFSWLGICNQIWGHCFMDNRMAEKEKD